MVARVVGRARARVRRPSLRVPSGPQKTSKTGVALSASGASQPAPVSVTSLFFMSAFLQRAADALALAALCGIGDAAPSRSAPWLALVGATTFFLLPLAIASLLLGTAGKFFTALVAVDLASLLTRAAALHDRSQPLDRPNTTSFGYLAQALLFFPETLYRSMGQGPHAAGLIASQPVSNMT